MDEATREAFERIHDEDKRQNRRLDELERVTKTLQEITSSVQELALNMKHMAEEQAKQGQKLDQLEKAPLDNLKAAEATAQSTIVGIIVGALATGLIQIIVANI